MPSERTAAEAAGAPIDLSTALYSPSTRRDGARVPRLQHEPQQVGGDQMRPQKPAASKTAVWRTVDAPPSRDVTA